MIEMLEIGNMTAFTSSALVTWAAFALSVLFLSAWATRAGLLSSASKPAQVRAPVTMTPPAATGKPMPRLDIKSQVDRLYAVISDCERLATHAARCHATARAELDQADYQLTALVAADPLLQRISTRARLAAPAKPRFESSTKPALRLAA